MDISHMDTIHCNVVQMITVNASLDIYSVSPNCSSPSTMSTLKSTTRNFLPLMQKKIVTIRINKQNGIQYVIFTYPGL